MSMEGKDKGEISKNSNKTATKTSTDFNNTVSEGSMVTNVIAKRVHRAIIFQGGVSLGAYEAGVFQALVEQLSKEDENKRGLKDDRRPLLFDIVAGTSIGAMNAAIVVSSIIEGKSWKDSSKELVEFWKNQEYLWPTVADILDMNPMYRYWWDIMHSISKASKRSANTLIEAYSNLNPYFKKWYDDILMNYFHLDPNFWKDYLIDGWYIPSTAEAVRRYYSAKQFHTLGAPNVASGIIPWSIFGKFFDLSEQSNFMPRPDNKHLPGYSLKKTLQEFAHFPIKTKAEEGQPRFLLVAIDVETGDAVTFDSFEKKEDAKDVDGKILKDDNGNNKTRYYSVYGANEQSKHIVFYDKGVEIEHVLASGTFPNFFEYPKFKVQEDTDLNFKKKKQHNFWDGGFRSNTPLREVIHAHRDYWHEKDNDKEEDDVPDLEVYIANLWPAELKEEPLSFDHDFVKNRKLNIIFSDKTHYDEQVAEVVSDYIDLAKKLKNLAERSGASKEEIKSILEKHGRSKGRKGQIRRYNNLIGGRFKLTKVVRIDHKDDGNEVANKIYDYSYTTIEKLMKDGYCDALNQMGIQSIKDGIIELDNKTGTNNDNHIHILEKKLQLIQKSTKMDDGYDGTMNDVEDFIINVESLPDRVDNLSLKEEKASLIHAAKQFQEIIKRTKSRNLLLPQIL
jgi:NTE family protein